MRVAVITGAANGIGKAIARRMAEEGYFTFLIDMAVEEGNKLSIQLSPNSTFMPCNICKEAEVDKLFLTIMEAFGKVDVLVNCAGIIKDNVVWKMPVKDFDDVLEVNLKGTWLMCRRAAEIMKQQQYGRIINITSRAWLGNFGQSNYAASKAGVVGLTRVLALELGKYNVLVNAIAPGLIDTPLSQKLTKEVRERLIEAQPTKCMGKPEDVANVVSFLSNENTNFITGQTIYVDGGKSIGAGL